MARAKKNTKTSQKLLDIEPIMPEYKKDYRKFQKKVREGDKVRISIRIMKNWLEYVLKDLEGYVSEVATYCIYLDIWCPYLSRHGYPTPWFAIHDWEILEKVERDKD